jgi:hypothetical protein
LKELLLNNPSDAIDISKNLSPGVVCVFEVDDTCQAATIKSSTSNGIEVDVIENRKVTSHE